MKKIILLLGIILSYSLSVSAFTTDDVFTRLIYNTDACIDNCYAIYEICNPVSSMTSLNIDYLEHSFYGGSVKNFKVEYEDTINQEYSCITGSHIEQKNRTHINNKTGSKVIEYYNVTINDYGICNRDVTIYKSIDDLKVLNSGNCKTIKISGSIGLYNSIDWIPKIKINDIEITQTKWAVWYNSYDYRFKDNLTSPDNWNIPDFPYVVNTSSGVSTGGLIVDDYMLPNCYDWVGIYGGDNSTTLAHYIPARNNTIYGCNGSETIIWQRAIKTNTTANWDYFGNSAIAADPSDPATVNQNFSLVYHFENNTGNQVADWSGDGFVGNCSKWGTGFAECNWTGGKMGAGLLFNAPAVNQGSSVNISDVGGALPSEYPIAFSFWVMDNSSSLSQGYFTYRKGNINVRAVHYTSGGFLFTTGLTDDTSFGITMAEVEKYFTFGKWNHIYLWVGSASDNNISVWINGVPQVQNYAEYFSVYLTTGIRLGKAYYYFNGSIDEFRITTENLSYDFHNASFQMINNSNLVNSTLGILESLDNPMNFTLISYSPSTLNETSVGNYTRKINITDLDGINVTKCFSAITIYDSITGTYYNSIRIPANNKAENVSGYDEYGKIFRGDNRNKSKIFEGLPFTEYNIWKWNILDSTNVRMDIEDGGTVANITINGELHTLLFPSIWPLDRTELEAAPKTMDSITKNNPKLIGYINPFIDGNYTLHHHLYLNYTGSPDELLIIRYCNKSYDPTSNIKPKNSPWCSTVVTLNRTESRTYVYSTRNSSYVEFVIPIYNRSVAGIGATDKYFLALSTEATTPNEYQVAVANSPTSTNATFNETYLSYTSNNDGATWTSLVGTYDTWVAPIQDGKQVQHKFVCYDDNNNNYTSPLWTYDIGRAYFPPTRTVIEYIYSDYGGYDYITNGTHNATMTFRFLVGIDPDNGTVISNATIINATNHSYVALINASFGLDGLDVNITFNSTGIANGTYRVKTVAIDDEGSITEFITFNDFLIGVPIPNTAPNLTSVLCTPDTLLPNASISILPTGQDDSEANTLYYYCSDSITPNSTNTNCSEGNTGYAYPYASMDCTFIVESATGTYTKYCRTYDGEYYSDVRWDNYTIITTTIPYFNENTTIETLEIGHQIIDVLGYELIKSKGNWRDKLLMIYVVIICFLFTILLIIITLVMAKRKRGQ